MTTLITVLTSVLVPLVIAGFTFWGVKRQDATNRQSITDKDKLELISQYKELLAEQDAEWNRRFSALKQDVEALHKDNHQLNQLLKKCVELFRKIARHDHITEELRSETLSLMDDIMFPSQG